MLSAGHALSVGPTILEIAKLETTKFRSSLVEVWIVRFSAADGGNPGTIYGPSDPQNSYPKP